MWFSYLSVCVFVMYTLKHVDLPSTWWVGLRYIRRRRTVRNSDPGRNSEFYQVNQTARSHWNKILTSILLSSFYIFKNFIYLQLETAMATKTSRIPASGITQDPVNFSIVSMYNSLIWNTKENACMNENCSVYVWGDDVSTYPSTNMLTVLTSTWPWVSKWRRGKRVCKQS
jgi:hypothetical protein